MNINMLYSPLLQIIDATTTTECITIKMRLTSSIGLCPVCNTPSSRVHNFYQRKLQDLPISGHYVKLLLHVRKLFCDHPSCARKLFTQQERTVLQLYARRFNRTNQTIASIGLAAGSKPGFRICQVTSIAVSASTILRLIKKIPLPLVNTPAVVGIDDFAFKKGNNYGTILVDLKKRQPIDLLPDRTGETVEKWLREHPGVSIVSRNRSSVYAYAITNACPDAIQAADRWHLLKNLGENAAKCLDRYGSLIKQTAQEVFFPSDTVNSSASDSANGSAKAADIEIDMDKVKAEDMTTKRAEEPAKVALDPPPGR